MKGRRLGAVLLCCCLLLPLGGCSMLGTELGAQLVPPEAPGEQEAIRSALESYLAEQSVSGGVKTYKLKFPHSGDYRTAFILKDLDGDGTDEALVFYIPGKDGGNVHVNFLCKRDGGWQSAADWTSESTEVREVRFGDVCGDGRLEMFVGWELNNTRDSQLVLYSFSSSSMTSLGSYFYDKLLIDRIASTDKQDWMVLRLGTTDGPATVRLMAERDGVLTEMGTVGLNAHIQKFGDVKVTRLSENKRGVYVDGYLDDASMVTELIYWDQTQLSAPFRGAEESPAVATLRESGLPCRDIDGDGQIEWPQSTLLPGAVQGDKSSVMWLTEWYTWDYSTQMTQKKLTGLMNKEDGYYFLLDENWLGQFTAFYQADTHTMTMMSWLHNQPSAEILRIVRQQKASSSQKVPESVEDGQEEMQYRQVMLSGGVTLDVWYRTDAAVGLDIDEILYRLTDFPQT